MNRKAKIVATIGPSSQDVDTLRKLVAAGMDVARLNFSHGTQADHAIRIQRIRAISEEMKKPITILQDLQGPKMRVGDLPPEGLELTPGQQVVLATVESAATILHRDNPPTLIPLDVPELAGSVKPGNRILLDDGQLELEVTSTKDESVVARVVLAGVLKSHKGVNLPGANLLFPGFTDKDREDLAFGLDQKVDVVAISFVRSAHDVELVRHAMCEFCPERADTPIIAKLERPEAIENLHEILHAADGVMVARGDLAVETSASEVPIVQKEIIQQANRHARLVITATQMLESMIHNPRPTRAEASDVANAVFDGTDAVMLSGETASGHYPVESVAMMDSIVRQAEENSEKWGHGSLFPEGVPHDDAVSITRAARELAHDRNVTAIAVFTQTGRTALLMSKARPRVPIFSFTPEVDAFRRLGLYWGVVPVFVPYASTVETMLTHVDHAMLAETELEPGQQVVVITGYPVGRIHTPNFALLHTVGQHIDNSVE